MTRGMDQREEKLSAALRDLAAYSRQSASPELGITLKDTFRRHHARRRRVMRMRIGLLCLCMAGLAGLFWLRSAPENNISMQTEVAHTAPSRQVQPPAEVKISQKQPRVSLRHSRTGKRPSTDARGFWALPAFELVPSGDQLRVVRMEMRGEDLRLVGAPVADEMVRRRVTADFVVGHDGTPYAVRLVQATF